MSKREYQSIPAAESVEEASTEKTSLKGMPHQRRDRKRCLRIVLGVVVVVLLLALAVSISLIVKTMTKNKRDKDALDPIKHPGPTCNNSSDDIPEKAVFPNIGYATFGYNLMKAYPLTAGLDPGLTQPIFKIQYPHGRLTADHRYSMPRGYTVIPDIAYDTSFSSQTIKTYEEFESKLSVSVSVNLHVFAFGFSANAQYQKMRSKTSSGSHVFVYSDTWCSYYTAVLDMGLPPPFEDGFILWAKRLVNSTDEDLARFLDVYGTHFVTAVTLGSKFVYQYEMSTSTYTSLSTEDVSVAAQASWHGLFVRFDAGFELDKSQKEAAARFASRVTTHTISVGIPPPRSRDPAAWLAAMKANPVPIHYKVRPLDELFTHAFMAKHDFDYVYVRTRIRHALYGGMYCQTLLGPNGCNRSVEPHH